MGDFPRTSNDLPQDLSYIEHSIVISFLPPVVYFSDLSLCLIDQDFW